MTLTLKFRNRLWVYCLFLLSFDSFSQVIITPDNQGIGTSIPYSSSRLTLDGKDQTNEVLSLKSSSSPNIYFYTPLVSSFANRAAYMGVNITEDGSFFDLGTYYNSNLGFNILSNGNKRIHIKSDGRVGIGYNPIFPDATLNIFSDDNYPETLRLTHTSISQNPSLTFYNSSKMLGFIRYSNLNPSNMTIYSKEGSIIMETQGFGRAFELNQFGNIGIPSVLSNNFKFQVLGLSNFSNAIYFLNNPGNSGDILSSNGSINAPSWIKPNNYAVSAKTSSGIILNYSPVNEQDLILNTENFDDGNIFNSATFTAAHSGVYEVYLEFSLVSVSQNNKTIELSIYRNGALPAVHSQIYTNHIHGWVNNVNESVFGAVGIYSVQYKELFKVNAGETLLFRVRNPDYEPITIYPKLLIKAIY